jgi:hypothetical protein
MRQLLLIRRRPGRLLTAFVATVLSALAVAGVDAGAAHASGIWNIADAATGRCLDSNDAGHVYTQPCNGGNYQNWDQIYQSNQTYILEDMQTGLCLGSFGNSDIMAKCGTVSGDSDYRWFMVGGDYGTVYQNEGFSSVLDSNAAGQVYPNFYWSVANLYQNWY